MPLPQVAKIILGQGSRDAWPIYSVEALRMPSTGDIWLRFGNKGPVGTMTKADALKLSEVLAKMANS